MWKTIGFSGIRCAALWEVFLPLETPPPPQELASFFGIFAALNETVIDTVMRDVSVD